MRTSVSLMAVLLAAVCVEPSVQCPPGYNFINNGCYTEVKVARNYNMANIYCQEQHSTLVTSISGKLHEELKRISSIVSHHWNEQVGGQCSVIFIATGATSAAPCFRMMPFYCRSKTMILQSQKVPAKAVNPTEPVNEVNPTEPVNEVNQTEPAKAVNPTEPAKAVNSTEPVNAVNPTEPVKEDRECQQDWASIAEGSMCVKLFEGKRITWQQARAACKNIEGDLVAVRDEKISNDIKGIMRKVRYWIGLHDENMDGTFSWLEDEEGTKFTNFRYKPRNILGNEYCVELIGNHDAKWNDKPCNFKRNYICQKAPQ